VLDLGRKRVRRPDTPHVPHNGDASLIHEETTGTLFSSDLFTQTGPADPTTESDIVAPPIAVAEGLPLMPPTPMAALTLRRLAALKPTTIALMHGPTFKGGWAGGVGEVGGALRAIVNSLTLGRTATSRSVQTSRFSPLSCTNPRCV
jgi:hypothetical protein